MIEAHTLQQLRKSCLNADLLPPSALSWVAEKNFWNIWVPKKYGGLELSFLEGLQTLKNIAKMDGSLGWTVTLCSGANFFIGNLKENVAAEMFLKPDTQICLGGSGGVFGHAEKIDDEHYQISGTWHFATGAPYLTHFTLNAEILQAGQPLLTADNTPKVLSFILPADAVKIIKDWNSMGLKASATHSFSVDSVVVHRDYSFKYDEFFLPQEIFKIPFLVLADLTLWVNYLGMAEHFLEEASHRKPSETLKSLTTTLEAAQQNIVRYSKEIEEKIRDQQPISTDYTAIIHSTAAHSVNQMSQKIIQIYPYLGTHASQQTTDLNQVFRDYFTATQHPIFTR